MIKGLIVDHKYRVNNPNIFSYYSLVSLPFWKGVLWAVGTSKVDYPCKVGDGRKLKFWAFSIAETIA
jgi:hypothetical protein